MAAESKQGGNEKNLFKNLTFFMRPCKERQDLRPVIEHEGGRVTSKATTECYKLAEKGSLVSREGYISTDYIGDCVKQRKLLSIESYRVRPGTAVRADSDKSFSRPSSDDSFEHASVIVKTSSRDCKGRTKYTKEEDVAIMTFLIEEHRYQDAMGKRVWKDMENMKITSHTAESMSARYRKYILHNLDKYKNDIERSWISRLRGYVEKEKEPEFSYDALFPQPRKKPLQMTTSPSKGKKDKPTNSSIQTKCRTEPVVELVDVFSQSSKLKLKSAQDNVDNGEKRQKGKERENAKCDFERIKSDFKTKEKKSGSPSKEVDIVELDDGRLLSEGKSNHEIDEWDSDIDTPVIDVGKGQKRTCGTGSSHSPSKRQKQKPESVSPCEEVFTSKTNSKVLTEINGPDRTDDTDRKNRNMNSVGNTTDEVAADNDDNITSSQHSMGTVDSVDDMLHKYLGTHKVKTKDPGGNQDVPANNLSPVTDNSNSGKHVGSSGEQNEKQGSKVLAKKNEKQGSKVLAKKNEKQGSKVLAKKNGTSNKKVFSGQAKDESDHKGRNKPVKGKARKGNAHINLSSSDEEEEAETHSDKSDGDSPGLEQAQDEVLEASHSNADNPIGQEIITICKAIAKDFGVEAGYVKQLLYGFSGDVNQTLRWMKFGPDIVESQPWTDSDDEELGKGELKALVSKYGKDSVKARLFFLEGL